MSSLICNKCNRSFKYPSQYKKHMERKTSCVVTVSKDKKQKIKVKMENKKISPSKQQVILLEDCIEGMKQLLDNSVDIIICDPPYNIGKDFGNNKYKDTMDKYLSWCDKWLKQCIRILKPRGTLYIYGFSEILAFIRVRIPIHVRWIIWHYTNKVTPSFLCKSCSEFKKVFNSSGLNVMIASPLIFT